MENEQQFVPYAPNALIMWGIVLGVLALFTQSFIEYFCMVSAGLFLAVFISIAAYFEYHMVRKMKRDFHSKELDDKHKFIENIYIFNSIFFSINFATFSGTSI